MESLPANFTINALNGDPKNEKSVFYSEFENTGLGFAPENRVKWSVQLTKEKAENTSWIIYLMAEIRWKNSAGSEVSYPLSDLLFDQLLYPLIPKIIEDYNRLQFAVVSTLIITFVRYSS